jgi:hypothetical protein
MLTPETRSSTLSDRSEIVSNTLAEEHDPMTDKKQSKYTTVKILTDIVRKARVTVAIRDVQLSDYLSELLAPIVDKDHAKALRDAGKASQD